MNDPEHITPRWCFNCEGWRDVKPWNIVDNGCRCRTCGWVISAYFKTLECTVCKRVCEGWPDYDGRLSCSHECAYEIGHVTRATMIERGRLKEEQPVRATEPKPTTTYTIGETEWAQRIATLEHMLAEERENVDTLRAAVEHAEQLFVDQYDARKAAEREIAELKARITTLEAMR